MITISEPAPIIYADVDGTVCESCCVVEPEIAALLERVECCFISGTDVPELKRMLPIPTPHWLLGCNGAEVVRFRDGVYETVWTAPSIDDKERIRGLLMQALHMIGAEPLTDDVILDRKYQITLSCLGRSAPSEAKRDFDPTGERRRSVLPFLREHLDLPISVGGTTSLDISVIGDKRAGLQNFFAHTAVPPTVFFGDGFPGNDECVEGLMPCVRVDSPADFRKKLLGRLT